MEISENHGRGRILFKRYYLPQQHEFQFVLGYTITLKERKDYD